MDIAKLVPQVYYDLIARILPGYFALLVSGKYTLFLDKFDSWASPLASVALAYAVGLVLDVSMAGIIFIAIDSWHFYKAKDIKAKIQKSFWLKFISITSPCEILDKPNIGEYKDSPVLLKMMAEATMLRSLAIMSALAYGWGKFPSALGFTLHDWRILAIAVAFFLLSIFSRAHLGCRFMANLE